jgi:transcriptional regulator with XRE-family HTH domain
MTHRPTLSLVPNCGRNFMRDLRALPAQHRPKMIVQALNAIDGRVGDIASGEPLEPVVFDLAIGRERQAPQTDVLRARGLEKLVGLFEKGHSPILGKVFPICQGTLSPLIGKAFPMHNRRPLPRDVLARNLEALFKKTGFSAPEVARKAQVDRKTVNNQLNARVDPRPEQVDAVAKIFGLNYWDLLNPYFDVDAETNETLVRLIELFSSANDTGKTGILSVAQLAADANKLPPPPQPGEASSSENRKTGTP